MLGKLRALIGKGTNLATEKVKQLGTGLNRLKSYTNATLNDLAGVIEQQIEQLTPYLTSALTTDAFLSSVAGYTGTLQALPRQVLPLLLKAPVGSPVSYKSVPTLEGVAKPELPNLTDVLFPSTEPAYVEVHLPAVQKAVDVLEQAPVATGATYVETAKKVREGSFAITAKMTDKAVEDVKHELAKSISEGTSQAEFIDKVAERLTTEGNPLSPPHIENVFRTNVMAAYSNAQHQAVQDTMVVDAFPYGAIGATADARVRKNHEALEHLGLDKTNIYRIDDPTFQTFRPPWEWNAVLPDSLIEGRVLFGLKTFYSGEVFEITTKKGNKFTVTPYHPILTNQGFTFAKNLTKGMNLIRNGDPVKFPNSSFRSNKYSPPTFAEQIFSSLGFFCGSIERSSLNLYGDEELCQGKVDIVSANSKLRNYFQTKTFESKFSFEFQPTYLTQCKLSSLTNDTDPFGRVPNSSISFPSVVNSRAAISNDSNVSRFRLGSNSNSILCEPFCNHHSSSTKLFSNLIKRNSTGISFNDSDCVNINLIFRSIPKKFDSTRFGKGSNLSISRYKSLSNHVITDPSLFSNLLNRYPTFVELDEVIGVERFNYSGHVYDFQTETGYMVINGIIVSNCRCHWYPVTAEQAAKKGVEEAKEWVDRAKAMAKEKGGTFYQYLNITKPVEPNFVDKPNFEPPKEFKRELT